MSLLESICCTNRTLKHLDLHQERVDNSYRELYGVKCPHNLKEKIAIPESVQLDEKYKCRVEYGESDFQFTFSKYKAMLPTCIKLIHHNTIDYHLKYANRTELEKLLNQTTCEEILIVKNGAITDASKYNVCFYDGSFWFTSSSPLLTGIMRDRLIKKNLIVEKQILVEDLKNYSHLLLINALNPFNPSKALSIRCLEP